MELRREQNSILTGRRKRQIQTGPYTGNDRYDGYMMDLLSRVKAYMRGIDFEYEVELVPDGKYGHKSKYSKKWDGMIGEVLRKVSYQSCSFTYHRQWRYWRIQRKASVCPSFPPSFEEQVNEKLLFNVVTGYGANFASNYRKWFEIII